MPPPHAISLSSIKHREEGDNTATDDNAGNTAQSDDKNVWLFNIRKDPLEVNDLSGKFPELVRKLLSRLEYYNSTAVTCRYPPIDARDDPNKHGGVWSPWL